MQGISRDFNILFPKKIIQAAEMLLSPFTNLDNLLLSVTEKCFIGTSQYKRWPTLSHTKLELFPESCLCVQKVLHKRDLSVYSTLVP